MKKFLSLMLSLAMLLPFCCAASVNAGIYMGIGDSEIGGKGAIEVAVTLDENGVVTDIKVTKNSDTPGISDSAVASIPAIIIEQQTTNVDAIAGATKTSNAVMMAVLDAVTKAGLDTVKWSTKAENIKEDTHVYTGIGDSEIGGKGAIEVLVTVDKNGVVTDINVTKNSDTPGISDSAVASIPAIIIEQQTTNVDAIAGATKTSNAVMMAVLDAVTKAGLDTVKWSTKAENIKEDTHVYTGIGDSEIGGKGAMEVIVTVDKNGVVTDIKVTKNSDTPGISDSAVANIPAIIIEQQTTNVDAIAGATKTSNAIMMAVLDAVTKAGLDTVKWSTKADTRVYTGIGDSEIGGKGAIEVIVTVDKNGVVTDIKVTKSSDTPGISDSAVANIPAIIIEQQTTNVDAIAGATKTSNAIMMAVLDAVTKAGLDTVKWSTKADTRVYTGIGDSEIGGKGAIEVIVTVDKNGVVTNIKVTKNSDTPGISDPAVASIPAIIIEQQTTNVDAIAGATQTSNAIMMAVLDAVTKAGLDTVKWSTKSENTEEHRWHHCVHGTCKDCGRHFDWSGLNTLTLPAAIKEVEPEAFMNVSAQVIIVPNGCVSIGSRAFANCTNLRYVILPSTLETLADDAFAGCGSNVEFIWQ